MIPNWFEWLRIFKPLWTPNGPWRFSIIHSLDTKDLNDSNIWIESSLKDQIGDIILFQIQIFEWIENLQGPLGDIILFQRFEWCRESSRTTWWHYSIPKIWMIENLQGPLGDIILFQRFEWSRIFKDHLVTLFYSKDLNDWESSRTTWWHYSIQRFEWSRIFKDHLVTLFYSKDLNVWESSRTTWWHYSIPKIWMIENLQGPLGDIILFQRFEWLRIFKDHLVTLFHSKDLNDRESSRTTWWHYSNPKIWMIENLQGPLGDIFYSKDLNDWESSRTTWWHYSTPKMVLEWWHYSRESSRTTWWHYSIPKIWMIENLQGPLGDIILFQRFEWLRIFKDHLVTLFYSEYLNDWESSRTTWWHYSIPKIWMIENLQGPLGDIIYSKDLNDWESWRFSIIQIFGVE